MACTSSTCEDLLAERWYSVDEIATHLGISCETVYRWIDHRGLPAQRVGKFWKFNVTEVDDWVRAGSATEESGPPTKGQSDER